MNPRTDLWLQNLVDEREGAALYDGLASVEADPGKAKSFRELADGERKHADVWARKLEKEGVPLPKEKPSARVRLLVWLAKRLGTKAVLPLVLDAELGDAEKYAQQGGDATALAEEERGHERVLSQMQGEVADARVLIARRERWHRSGRQGSLRAAIFGMNDGLVSNLALVMGVAGAGTTAHTLQTTGIAGLLAGAFSMAAGELISVSSQRDLLARQIAIERRELTESPDEEKAELVLLYMQKGLTAEHAGAVATQVMKNPEQALDTLVREELGLDPEDLGSPWSAAASSFAMFAVGAMVPVVPFFGLPAGPAVWASVGLAAVVLSCVGILLAVLSGTHPLKSAARMLGLAAGAALATNAIGRLFGT